MAGTRTASLSAEKKVKQRARILAHYGVTQNVAATCRYFGISRTTFYQWRQRFEVEGVAGLRDRSSRPTMIHFQIPPEVIALVCQVRRERDYGAPRLSLFLQRYHQVYISPTTLLKIFRQHGLRERTWKGARRPPKRQPLPRHVEARLQKDVTFVPRRITGARQFNQPGSCNEVVAAI